MPRKKQFDKEEALNKSMDLFWDKGFHATSVNDLVSALGINRASLYDTFIDKEHLYIQSLERYIATKTQAMRVRFEQGESIKLVLKDTLYSFIQDAQNDPAYKGCFIVNACVEISEDNTQIAEIIRKTQQENYEGLAKALHIAQQNQEIPTEHTPEALAQFYINTLNSLQILARTATPTSVLENIVKVAMSVIEK